MTWVVYRLPLRMSLIAGVLLSIQLSGCLSGNNIQPQSDIQLAPDEGVVVIGVPQGIHLSFHSGNVIQDKFFDDEFLPKGFYGTPQSGYFIRKLKATGLNRGYGFTSIHMSQAYGPSCGEDELVLHVKPGVIQYYMDIFFVEGSDSVSTIYQNDMTAAQQYIKTIFPKSTLPIIAGDHSRLIKGTCYPTKIFIPLYLPNIN